MLMLGHKQTTVQLHTLKVPYYDKLIFSSLYIYM